MPVGADEPDDISTLNYEECKRELAKETDINRLRALVAIRHKLLKMYRTSQTGKVEIDVRAGLVKRVVRPDATDVA